MSSWVQDTLVFVIVAGAALYLLHRLTGWKWLSLAKKPAEPKVVLGARMQRGLKHARTGKGIRGPHAP